MAPISLHAAQLEAESNKFQAIFEEGESEATWNKFNNALVRMNDITCGSWELPTFAATVKQKWKFGIVACLNSDRTKLVKDCLMLLGTISGFLKERFDESLLLPILKLCGKANKVIVNTASATLIHCINSANGFPALITHFTDAHKNPSKTFRIAAIDGLVATVECCTRSKLEHYYDKIEFGIAVFITDSLPQVREFARLLYSAYQEKFSTERLLASLPDTSKKYLKIEEKFNAPTVNWKTPKRDNQEHEEQARISGGSKRNILRSLKSPDITPSLEKTTQGSILHKTGEIGSTRLVNMFSKGGIKESLAKKTGEIKEFSLGGAMRVLREPLSTQAIIDGFNRPTSKALRVPSLSSAVAEVSAKPNNGTIAENTKISSQNFQSTEVVDKKPALKRKIVVAEFAKPKKAENLADLANQRTEVVDKKPAFKRKIVVAEFAKPKKAENLPDLANLYIWAKSSDWQTRCKAFETLMKLINSNDFKISPKLTEMVLLGLDDTHFRVVNSVYDAISCLVNQNHNVEAFFVKTVNAAYNNSKSRLSSLEHSEDLLRKMVASLNEIAIPIIVNMIGEPGLMRKPRARNGLLSMLCSVRIDFLSSYISKAVNFKILLHKMASMGSDSEDDTQNKIKEVLKVLYLSHSDSFWLIWNTLKTSEQNRINKLFGNDISEHRELLGEFPNVAGAALKVQPSLNSPVSRIPVMLVSSSIPVSDQIFNTMENHTGSESAPIETEALQYRHSESEDDKESENTLKDEFEETTDEIYSAKEGGDAVNNFMAMLDGEEMKSHAESDLSDSLEKDHEAETTRRMNSAVGLPEEIAAKAITAKSFVENYDDLVSDFINKILDEVVESNEPDDSHILSYINNMLNEVAQELEMAHLASHKENFTIIPTLKAPVSIPKAAPAAEALQQWHIPSTIGSPENEKESISVEPWYVPSWNDTCCVTVTMNNLPDILTTLRSSNNEEEIHSCFILLQSLLESHDADNYCLDILSALLENKTSLCLPDLDLKESILSNCPQYFSSEILFSCLEKISHTSLRVCLSILNDLLSLSSSASQLLKTHSAWKDILIQGLQSNRSATRHTSLKLFKLVLNILEASETASLWRQLEISSQSMSRVIKSLLK